MHVDGREVTVSGSLLQPLTRRTNDILRVALSGALLAIVITSSLITRTRWDGLEKSISRIVGVLTPTQSDVVYLVYGLAVLALPFMILIGLILARQWRLLVPYAAAALITVLGAVDQRHGPGGPAVAFRPVRPAAHRLVPVPRRPALDRHACRGAHRVRPVAAGALAALVVGAAAGVHPDPPGGQRHRAGPLAAGSRGRLVLRRAGDPGQRHPRSRGAAGRRGARDGQTRIRGDRAEGGPPRRIGAAGSCGRHRGSRRERRGRDVRTASTQRRRPAAGVADPAAARERDRPAAGVDAPRCRAPRPDGHRHR